MGPESQIPSVEVTVWSTGSFGLVQLTVLPTTTYCSAGVKAKSAMATFLSVAAGCAAAAWAKTRPTSTKMAHKSPTVAVRTPLGPKTWAITTPILLGFLPEQPRTGRPTRYVRIWACARILLSDSSGASSLEAPGKLPATIGTCHHVCQPAW